MLVSSAALVSIIMQTCTSAEAAAFEYYAETASFLVGADPAGPYQKSAQARALYGVGRPQGT